MRKIKYCFTTEPLLRRFDLTRPIHIFMDASGYVAVAILMQKYNNHLHPILFWSWKFTSAKQNYSIMSWLGKTTKVIIYFTFLFFSFLDLLHKNGVQESITWLNVTESQGYESQLDDITWLSHMGTVGR